jgi:hypothetical protein
MYSLNLINLLNHGLLLRHFLWNYYLTMMIFSNVLLRCIILQARLSHYYVFRIISQYFDQTQLLDMLYHQVIQNQLNEGHSKINSDYFIRSTVGIKLKFSFSIILTSLNRIYILISSNDFPNFVESSSASDRTV